jgi:D-amino-acid dehydrogenase
LESERGYNTTLPVPGVALEREIIFAERKFTATPLAIGLRIGGAAEFAGLTAAPNYRRSRALVTLARRYLPGLATERGTEWMGHRPATPDGLPVIGSSPRHGGVFYAFGHGHVGLTLAATTGRLIADLVAGRPSVVDLEPYSIERFGP